MIIQIDPNELPAIIAGRGAVRRLVMQKTKYITGNVIVIRCVGQIAPYMVAGGPPTVIGTYSDQIGGGLLEIFQTSAMSIGEYFWTKSIPYCCVMNDIITATDYSPAITEFVAIRD